MKTILPLKQHALPMSMLSATINEPGQIVTVRSRQFVEPDARRLLQDLVVSEVAILPDVENGLLCKHIHNASTSRPTPLLPPPFRRTEQGRSGIQEAFTNASKFKSASFKSITATLTAAQKNQAVQLLMDLEIESNTGRKVDWNTKDFDLADSIRDMAELFIRALKTLVDTADEFESLFPTVGDQKQILQSFAGKVTENNYIEKVEYLLTNRDQFSDAIQTIDY